MGPSGTPPATSSRHKAATVDDRLFALYVTPPIVAVACQALPRPARLSGSWTQVAATVMNKVQRFDSIVCVAAPTPQGVHGICPPGR
jgi:hypothetical protein